MEILSVMNTKTNSIYQVQVIFGKRKPQNPIAVLNLDQERAAAKDLIGSVSFNN